MTQTDSTTANGCEALELRILSGLHQGAGMPLERRAYTLGSSMECDVVLHDEGILAQHAQLEWDGERLMCRWLFEAEVDVVELARGVALSLGPVEVMLCDPTQDWSAAPNEDRLVEPEPKPELTAPQPELIKASEVPSRNRVRISAAVFMAGCALVTAAWTLGWPMAGAGDAHANQPDKAAHDLMSHSAEVRQQLDALLAAQGYGKSVRVQPGGAGVWQVNAMLDEDRFAQLAADVHPLGKGVRLHSLNGEEVQALVQAAATQQAQMLQTTLTVQSLAELRFALSGVVQDESERDALLNGLRKEFGNAVVLESKVDTKTEQAQRMVEALRAKGFHQLQGHWNGNVLEMQVSLAGNEVPLWEGALAQIAPAFALPWKTTVKQKVTDGSGMATVAAVPAPAYSNLPFRLQSVSSAWPVNVVLDDGARLFLDGARNGWRLVEVTAQAAVFEGAQSRRVTVLR